MLCCAGYQQLLSQVLRQDVPVQQRPPLRRVRVPGRL
jgi:hypothetical protein